MSVPLIEAVGRSIRCPDRGCDAIARVEVPPPTRPPHANPHANPFGPVQGPGLAVAGGLRWLVVSCPRTGRKQFPATEPVSLIEDDKVTG